MDLFAKLKQLKLLLIDDDEWIRDSMRLFFESEGCDLVTLVTAEEALEMIGKHHFDIIIADLRLPGMSGIEMFKRIRGTYRCPVKILITAYKDEQVVRAAKKAGVHDLIEKPFNTEIIEASLSKLLSWFSGKDANLAGQGLD